MAQWESDSSLNHPWAAERAKREKERERDASVHSRLQIMFQLEASQHFRHRPVWQILRWQHTHAVDNTPLRLDMSHRNT